MSIPRLYKEDETNFNHNGIGALDESLSAIVTERANGILDAEIEYPISGRYFKEITKMRLVRMKPNDRDDEHNFRIINITKTTNPQTVRITLTSKSNDLNGHVVQELKTTQVQPVQIILNNMKNQLIPATNYTFKTDYTTAIKVDWFMRNALNVIAGSEGSVIDLLGGGEIKRNDDNIYIYRRRGYDNVATIKPGKNLKGLELSESTANVVTKIIPYCRVQEDINGENREITIVGTPVNSPLINNYPIVRTIPVDFTDNDIKTLASLNSHAATYFTSLYPEADKPTINLKVDLLQLSDSMEHIKFNKTELIGLFDTVTVYAPKYDVDVLIKINMVEYDVLRERVIKFEAGQPRATFAASLTQQYTNALKEQKSYTDRLVNTVMDSANSKNKVFHGPDEPPASMSNLDDIWWKKTAEGEVELWIFDGAYWQPQMTSGINAETAAQLALAQQALDNAKADLEAVEAAMIDLEATMADLDAEMELTKTATTEAKAAADDAQLAADDAAQAAQQAQQAGDNAATLANQAKAESATAITNANTAVSKANQAVEDAGFSKTQAQDAKQLADEAKQDALNAVSQSGTAKQIAETASSAASGAVTTANQAKQDALNAVGQAGNAIVDAQAALDAYNNMEIGGRNYFSVEAWKARPILTSNGVQYLEIVLEANTQYTLSTNIPKPNTISYDLFFFKGTETISSSANGVAQNEPRTITTNADGIAKVGMRNYNDALSAGTSWIMLTKGNKALDWTPAPEDVQVQISTINGELSQKVSQTTFNTLQGTVSSQGTQINQNKSDIALKANKSTVDTLTGRVSTAEGQITVQAGQIAQRLTSAQVESLVNGKGYATQTSVNSQVSTINGELNEHTSQLQSVVTDLSKKMYNTQFSTLSTGNGATDRWIPLVRVTLRSAWVTATFGMLMKDREGTTRTADVVFHFGVNANVEMTHGQILFLNGESMDSADFKGVVTQSTSGLREITVYVRTVDNYITWLIQPYNVARTDTNTTIEWLDRAAIILDLPSGTQYTGTNTGNAAEIATAKSSLTTNVNQINQRIDSTNNSIQLLTQTVTQQGEDISSTSADLTVANGKITGLTTKTDGHTTQIGSLQSSYNGLQSTVSQVQTDLKGIGVRNFLRGSSSEWQDYDFTGWATPSQTYKLSDLGLSVGNTLYVSAEYDVISGTGVAMQMSFARPGLSTLYLESNRISVGEKGKAEVVGTIPGGTESINIRHVQGSNGTTRKIGKFRLTGVYKSTVPVDWTPAPEDLTTVQAFSDFKQDVNGFKQTVSSTYAKQTALNTVEQTVNSTTQTIATMQTDLNGKATVTALNSVKNTVDSHTQTISSHNGRITTAQQTADGAKTTATDAQGRVSTVEQNVNGLQTTVADKADKSQISQLSGQISSVVSDVSKKITDESFFTSITSGSNSGEWTLFAQTKLTTRYADVQCGFDLIGRGTGDSLVYSAELFIRHKQQDVFGGSTLVEMALSNASVSAITKNDFKAVVVQNSTTSVTVNYYMRINNTYSQFKISPFNKISKEDRVINFYANQPFISSLPSGTTFNATERGVMAGLSGAKSQITQLSDQIDLRVTKGDISNQINITTQGVRISGSKISISGETFIDNGIIKTAHIADANISTAKIADLAVSNAKIGNLAVTEGKIGNLAVTNAKIGDLTVNSAKLANASVIEAKIGSAAVTTAKIGTAAVTTAKIGNLAVTDAKIANATITSASIQDAAIISAKIANLAVTGAKIANATISSAKIISLDASKVTANSLSAITTNTGALEVTGWLDFSTDNRGLRGTYNFGDSYGGAYNPRWFDGDLRLSHRYLMFKSQVYNVTSSDTRGNYRYHTESFYGPDYLKLRQYSNSSMSTLLKHVDITADAIIIGDRDWATRAIIKADGSAMFNGRVRFNSGIDIGAPDDDGLRVGRINAPSNYQSLTINQNRALADVVFGEQNIYFNETRTIAADFRIGRDGSNINGGRVVASNAIYNRTYSGAANMIITPEGVLGRSTSALKYKADVRTANDVMSKAKKVIQLQPKSWLDKGELADGVATKRHYGFIADEFDDLGLPEVVIYGDMGQVESLAYDRISMYHNVILSDHEKRVIDLESKIEELEKQIGEITNG